jgi:hypothetical protein
LPSAALAYYLLIFITKTGIDETFVISNKQSDGIAWYHINSWNEHLLSSPSYSSPSSSSLVSVLYGSMEENSANFSVFPQCFVFNIFPALFLGVDVFYTFNNGVQKTREDCRKINNDFPNTCKDY